MGFLKQTWTLTNKNILIALRRHTIATLIRAFILPVGYMIFLTFARNLFISNNTFGVGSPQPIRSLQDGLAITDVSRQNVLFVNNGFRYAKVAVCLRSDD
jgi:ATP-binding cassette subfamily A (ABC1) protein 3